MPSPTQSEIQKVPKVLLHDHLDGGVRPQTVIDLARDMGYDGLPSHDVEELTEFFFQGAKAMDLDQYLEAFVHTFGVMQTPEALSRVAYECAQDLHNDGVVLAEIRFAPELHTQRGLSHDEVVESVIDGFNRATSEMPIRIGILISAMRTAAHSLEMAELAVRWRDDIVVGFDIAGEEAGHPPTRHLDAFHCIQRNNFHSTIHAGEGFGLPSIWEAVQYCGAERLGHGVRIIEDIEVQPDGEAKLGRLASFVRDRRIPLELCPTSNVHTRAAASIAEHPIGLLKRLKYRVTMNTDNRLMSDITLSEEFAKSAEAFDWTWKDIRWLTINAAKSSFIAFEDRLELIDDVIKPGYAHLLD